jgi:hypothetical protein
MDASRRRFLRHALLGPVGLRALATGLPASVLLSGIPSGEAAAAEPLPPQFLLYLNARAGHPFNANAPGCYGISGVTNNPQAQMAPTSLQLGGISTTAAAPWASLPQWVLDRSCFIHHRTYQNAHPQHEKVMGLVGSAKGETGTGSEHMASLVASETADALGTVQREPVTLGGENVTFKGSVLQSLRPRTLAQIFSPLEGAQLQLAQLRDTALDEIHANLRAQGTTAQRAWLDRHASSREQVKLIDETLLERFANINGNGQNDQLAAAIALFLMKITPVVTVDVAFGGDNHTDAGLTKEGDQTVAALASLNTFFTELDAVGLADQVTVANLSVFGRTLGKKGTQGRDHNLNHHVMMICGPAVQPGVYGGIKPSGNDFGATSIDSATGLGGDGGDIPEDETLEAAAKTLATVVGLSPDRVELRVDGGKVIQAAVAS